MKANKLAIVILGLFLSGTALADPPAAEALNLTSGKTLDIVHEQSQCGIGYYPGVETHKVSYNHVQVTATCVPLNCYIDFAGLGFSGSWNVILSEYVNGEFQLHRLNKTKISSALAEAKVADLLANNICRNVRRFNSFDGFNGTDGSLNSAPYFENSPFNIN